MTTLHSDWCRGFVSKTCRSYSSNPGTSDPHSLFFLAGQALSCVCSRQLSTKLMDLDPKFREPLEVKRAKKLCTPG